MQAVATDPFEPEALHRLERSICGRGGPKRGASCWRLLRACNRCASKSSTTATCSRSTRRTWTLTTTWECSTGIGAPRSAANEYRRALAINPADLGARNNLANILLNTDRSARPSSSTNSSWPCTRAMPKATTTGGGLSAARQSGSGNPHVPKRPCGPIQSTRMLTTTWSMLYFQAGATSRGPGRPR